MKRVTYICGILAVLGVLVGCGQSTPNVENDTIFSTTEASDTQIINTSESYEITATSELENATNTEIVELEEIAVTTENSMPPIEESYITETMKAAETSKETLQETAEEVVCIRITNGNNGKQVDVTDVDAMNMLLEKVNQLELLIEETESRLGYQYRLQYLDSQNNSIKSITLQGNYVVIDKKSYKVTSTEDIVDFIENTGEF